MVGIVAFNPTGCTVPFTLKVHEVARSTTYLAGDTTSETVKLRHDSRYPLE